MTSPVYLLQMDNLRFIEALNKIKKLYPDDEQIRKIADKALNAK